MLPSSFSSRVVLGMATLATVLLLAPAAQAQVSFFSAPPPAEAPAADSESGEANAGESLGNFAGKLPVSFTFSVREGYDSNVYTDSTDPIGSFYTNFAAGVAYAFGSPRLQLGTSLNGGVTWYYGRSDDPIDFNLSLSLNATYLASPRLTLSLTTTTAYLPQPDIAMVGNTNHQNGDYFYSNNTIAAAYQWSDIISTITSYNFSAYVYADEQINNNQGNISQTLSQSINWLWKPKTTLVADFRINLVEYFGTDMRQIGTYYLVGFDQIFNPKFFWNVRVGAQVNYNQNPIDGESVYVGPFMESTLRYQFRPSSSLSWNMRYGTEASGLDDVTQRQTFRTGLDLTHAFTPRLSASLGVYYLLNYYDQDEVIEAFTENIVGFSAGLNYKVTRWAALQAGYSFTIDMAPEYTGRQYTRNIAFVGAGFSF